MERPREKNREKIYSDKEREIYRERGGIERGRKRERETQREVEREWGRGREGERG